MTTGRRALGTIQGALTQQQQRLDDVERRLSDTSRRLAEIDVGRGEAIEALARLRLEHLERDRATTRVADADARVLAMLERRQERIDALHADLERLAAEAASAEGERERLADALEDAEGTLDEAEAVTQSRLEADETYREARVAAQEAARTADHAAEKAAQSAEERSEKERAYHDDPLFMYLWRRRYGTNAYRAAAPIRWLDGKVARHVGYEGARLNFTRLQELPERLREHAERVAERAEAEHAALAALDRAARDADGVSALEAARDEAASSLAAADERLAVLALERDAAHEALDRTARGEDDAYREALAFLASELGRDDLQALRRQALATPFPEDDAIVARLLDLERDRTTTEAALAELKEVAARNRERVRELERLRADYTRQRMDQPGSTFADGALVATVLAQFLQGAMTRDALWRVLEQQRRQAPQRSDPTFGSGGFGRGSPWSSGGGAPRPPSIPRAPSLPRPPSGGFGGGGFRTGGRIGGGGFRTGGKF
jgi:chromosome segregation ATPase